MMAKTMDELERKIRSVVGFLIDGVDEKEADRLVDDLYKIADRHADEAHSEGYSSGFDDGESNVNGKIQDGINDAVDGLIDNLKTGLDLIDTDRTAAKNYLDRATRSLGKHLIEVSPCLL